MCAFIFVFIFVSSHIGTVKMFRFATVASFLIENESHRFFVSTSKVKTSQ